MRVNPTPLVLIKKIIICVINIKFLGGVCANTTFCTLLKIIIKLGGFFIKNTIWMDGLQFAYVKFIHNKQMIFYDVLIILLFEIIFLRASQRSTKLVKDALIYHRSTFQPITKSYIKSNFGFFVQLAFFLYLQNIYSVIIWKLNHKLMFNN